MTQVNKQPRRWGPKPLRPVLVLVAAVLGIATSFVGALALVPRVRVVEVVTVFAGAVGGGAGLVWAVLEFRRARSAALRR